MTAPACSRFGWPDDDSRCSFGETWSNGRCGRYQ